MKQTFEIPNGCNRVTIEQQGNRIVTTFEPEFKEGDILVKKYKPGFSGGLEYIFILDNIDLDGLIHYKAHYSKKSKSVTIRYDYGIGNIKDSVHLELRYATEFEKQQLLNAIAKEGKQWNAEKKCIEDLKPKRWRGGERSTAAAIILQCHTRGVLVIALNVLIIGLGRTTRDIKLEITSKQKQKPIRLV